MRCLSKRTAILLTTLILSASLLASLGSSRRVRAYVFCTTKMEPLSDDVRILKEPETPDEWLPIVRGVIDRSC